MSSLLHVIRCDKERRTKPGALAACTWAAMMPQATARISSCGAEVIVQRAAQTLAPSDCSTIPNMACVRRDQSVAETLMVSLAMIMRNELTNSLVQGTLTEPDHAVQAGFLDSAYESLGVRI